MISFTSPNRSIVVCGTGRGAGREGTTVSVTFTGGRPLARRRLLTLILLRSVVALVLRTGVGAAPLPAKKRRPPTIPAVATPAASAALPNASTKLFSFSGCWRNLSCSAWYAAAISAESMEHLKVYRFICCIPILYCLKLKIWAL